MTPTDSTEGEKPLDLVELARDILLTPYRKDPFVDTTKQGIFRDHSCPYCGDGARPCRNGNPYQCGNPRARND